MSFILFAIISYLYDMEGLSPISNDCGFNFHYNGSTCVTCPNGFYGRDCADQCATGLYGFLCHKLCRCPVDRCHHVYGCFSGIKDTSTLIVTRGDVLTSGSNNFEVLVPIPVNNESVPVPTILEHLYLTLRVPVQTNNDKF
ncbi:uncharacterized protein LOC111126394 isoform X3 [Crassostrea virginica]